MYQKKAFTSNVQVVMVSDPSVLPRGKPRKMLEHDERYSFGGRCRVVKLKIQCCDASSIVGFTLLEADQGGKLHPSENQAPNGVYVIVDARRKNGPIYIHPILVSNTYVDL